MRLNCDDIGLVGNWVAVSIHLAVKPSPHGKAHSTKPKSNSVPVDRAVDFLGANSKKSASVAGTTLPEWFR